MFIPSFMRRAPIAAPLLAAVVAAAFVGCESLTSPEPNPVVDLRVAPGHIHSFETDVTFKVAVTSESDGSPIRDFSELRVELARFESEDWSKQIPLTFDGTEYAGTIKFTATGAFEARVVGRRPGQAGPIEIHRRADVVSAVRPHFDAGGYRVEFETNTDEYPVAGEAITVRFLIFEDVPNPRPPVVGLAGVSIRCAQGADVGMHAAVESPGGTYSASHVFTGAGDASARIEFTGTDGNPASVEIPLIVN